MIVGLFFALSVWAQDSLKTSRPVVSSPPIVLNWKSVKLNDLRFSEEILPHSGVSLLTLADSSEKRFELSFYFDTGVYTFPRTLRPALGAAADLILQGGIGRRSYEDVVNELDGLGMSLTTQLDNQGKFIVQVTGLSVDFNKSIGILSDLFLRPNFDSKSLEHWKNEQVEQHRFLLDASSSRKQNRFMEYELNNLLLGPTHYFTSFFARTNEKAITSIKHQDVVNLGQQLVHARGLNVYLVGQFDRPMVHQISDLVSQLPNSVPFIPSWLPERPLTSPSAQYKTSVIYKKDMTQANVLIRHYAFTGDFNLHEHAYFDVLKQIYSASGGVVGGDRFSVALRADTGISYSPYAYANLWALWPNTNWSHWTMSYQSPNERLAESVRIALGTWNQFVDKGVQQNELDRARTVLMNQVLAEEKTIFNLANEQIFWLTRGHRMQSPARQKYLLNLEQVTDLKKANTLLKLFAASKHKAIVIMGAPSSKVTEELRQISRVQRSVAFDKLVTEINK